MQIAILQPTFLPWLGWFDIVDQVEQLVVLDDVAFSKQSWQQRNRLRTAKGLEYVTIPVRSAGRLGQIIADVELADTRFAGKLSKTLMANYARAAYFNQYFPELESVLAESARQGHLCELNMGIVEWILGVLGITTPTTLSSTLEVGGVRGDHVAEICESLGADQYLSPLGAKEYLIEDSEAFQARDIAIFLHNYEHPSYSQLHSPFIPYASAIDLIMNEGPKSLDVIRSGRRLSSPLELSADTNLGSPEECQTH